MTSVYNLLWSNIRMIWTTLSNFNIGGISLLSFSLAIIIISLVLSGLLNVVKNKGDSYEK